MAKRRVLIVGGGSAGWITAAYLNGALNERGAKPRVEITLVESPDVPRIGVGEATIPAILHILNVIGLDEIEFMRACDATYKQAIKYVDWVEKDGSHYYHPFSRPPLGPIDRSGETWMRSDRSIPYMDTVSAQPALCEAGLTPKMFGPWNAGPPLYYAFHMDAQKFADYLRDFSTPRGVKHIMANVTDVEKTDNGRIAAVNTDQGERLEADLFVDCTGFSARLIEKEMGVGYYDASQYLLCDRALAMQIPYDVTYPGEVRSYTTATALNAGWIWDIGLRTRRAVGYVHSSKFVSKEDAEAEMRAYEGPHCKDLPARFIDFKTGWRKKAWAGNCVAIGLSGGFMEPLESTGLYLADLGVVMLADHFPYRDEHEEALSFRYNRILSNRYGEILDFLNLHYCITKRNDTAFWREVQKPEHITDRLQAKLDFWRMKSPSSSDFEDQFFQTQNQALAETTENGEDRRPIVDTAKLWSHFSYEAILYGMHCEFREFEDQDGVAPYPSEITPLVVNRVRGLKAKLPVHETWLKKVLGMQDYPKGPLPAGWK